MPPPSAAAPLDLDDGDADADGDDDAASALVDVAAAAAGGGSEKDKEDAAAFAATQRRHATTRRALLALRAVLALSYGAAVWSLLASVPDLGAPLSAWGPASAVRAASALLAAEAGGRACERARDAGAARRRAEAAATVASELGGEPDWLAAVASADRAARFTAGAALGVVVELVGLALLAAAPRPAPGVLLLLLGGLPTRSAGWVPEPESGVMVPQSRRRRRLQNRADWALLAASIAASYLPAGPALLGAAVFAAAAMAATALSWERDVEGPRTGLPGSEDGEDGDDEDGMDDEARRRRAVAQLVPLQVQAPTGG